MKMLNEFVIKGSPETRTAQQKGARIMGRRIIFYEKPEVKKAKEELYFSMMPYVPDEPYEGPIYLRVLWLFDKKTMTKAENNSYKTSYPDLDNLAKGLLDVMTDLRFWNDDNEISKLELTKGWSKDYPGLFVQIWQLYPDEDSILEWRGGAYE